MFDPITGTPAEGIALVQGNAMRELHTGDLFLGEPVAGYTEDIGTYTALSSELQDQDWWGSKAAAEAAALEYGFTDDGVTEYFAYGELALNSGLRVQAVYVKSDGTLGNLNLQAGSTNTFVTEELVATYDYPWLNSATQGDFLA